MLKTWDGIRTAVREQLSASTTVCIADNDVGFGPSQRMWFYLVQTLTHPVRSSLRGKYHVLLSRTEARRLLLYLDRTLGTLESEEQVDAEEDAAGPPQSAGSRRRPRAATPRTKIPRRQRR
jgi:hypothetical protein